MHRNVLNAFKNMLIISRANNIKRDIMNIFTFLQEH